MPKRIAIVDIGSNSARVVIFQRTSRYGFHLIAQKKEAVRVSEGSYGNNGILQEDAINRTINALNSFKNIIHDYKARKTLIVATAAVRNAPNREYFLKKVKEATKLNIKVIDGKKEAYYGAVAAKNLLPINRSSITVDIGGGSTDIALIENSKIVDTISIDVGTIKIKELFFDKNLKIDEATDFIKKEFSKIPQNFKAQQVITIGGVLRALSKSIMERTEYSFKKIHAFEYDISNQSAHLDSILAAKNRDDLKELGIKESRYDTIKEGVLIFKVLLDTVGIDKTITSSVGIREGIFLHDMLRSSKGSFPKEINPSIISITDRLDMLELSYKKKLQTTRELYSLFKNEFENKESYLNHLLDAVKISNIGKSLTIYNEHKHAYYIASAELNWQYSHKDMLLIATILRSKGDKLIYKPLKKEHSKLLPSQNDIKWLGFIYTIVDILSSYSSTTRYNFACIDKNLIIYTEIPLPLLKDEIENLKILKDFEIKVELVK